MRRDWKAITFDWAALENYDDTEVCWICLTQREVAILKASIIPAYWATRWENLGETQDTLEARMAMIDGKLDCCGGDGGDSIIFVTNINILQINVNNIKYDGTTISINIYAPVTIWNEGGTADREAALCMASMSLVGTICALELQALTERYIGTALIFAALFILTGGLAAFGVLVVGSLIAGHSFTIARDALEDRAAQLAVACCMYEGLRGEPVTAVALAASLDSCGFTPGSNAAIVRDYVHRSIQGFDTYLGMLDAAGNAFVLASVMGLNLCECGDCGILTFDNPVYDLDYTLIFGTISGEGNPAQCGHGTVYTEPPPWPYRDRLELEIEMPTVQTVGGLSFDFNFYIADAPAGEIGFTIELRDVDHLPLAVWNDSPNPPQQSWESYTFAETPVADVKFIWVEIMFLCDCPNEKDLRVDNIRVFCS